RRFPGMTPSDGGPGTAVRVTPSRRRADEWAVVLAAADIPHWLCQRLDGWVVFVEPVDADAARDALAAYDRENAPEREVQAAVCDQVGPGVGLALVLLAGAGGNALTAVAHGGDHISVGGSTAVFGTIGILAALRVVPRGRAGPGATKSWVVVAASLALLTLLGTGPEADLLAHLFGLLVGFGLGPVPAPPLRPDPPART